MSTIIPPPLETTGQRPTIPPILTGRPVPPNTPIETKPPTLTKLPDTNRTFPCKQCGARIEFDPTKRALVCPYCGHSEEIAPATQNKFRELDYAAALAKVQADTGTITGRSSEIRCPACGATILLEDNIVTQKCPFCAAFLDRTTAVQSQSQICPEALLPFHISQTQAIAAFNQWIANLWFAPSNLKSMANLGQLSGVYVPYWTFDSMTYSHYTGERGDDYTETKFYTEIVDGKSVQRSRLVTKTRWTFVSGEVDHFFDDILVCASKSLPSPAVTKLEPWDLKDLEDFRTDFLSGFKTERYTVDLSQGFTLAQSIITAQVHALCLSNIGGDHQRFSSVDTQHVGVTFKHILLPLWLAVYRYNNQTYRILVNARTGELSGSHPWSVTKISSAIAAGVLAIVIILLIARAHH